MKQVKIEYEPIIVIPAFRRPTALDRLLSSIQRMQSNPLPKIIISIDGGASPEVVTVAHKFKKQYVNSQIIEHQTNIGLRDHILFCGEMALSFGAVIVLEDDLIVDPFFYEYAKQALFHYDNDDSIAGIALYAPELNEFAGLPFRPLRSGSDTYLMRTPCSWGQVWSKKQWENFKNWYEQPNVDELLEQSIIPPAIKGWPSTSWKKYFAAYMSMQELDFVYPYEALSSNCADHGGTHMQNGTILYQVALPSPIRDQPVFSFCNRNDDKCVTYDEYMEISASFVFNWLQLSQDKLVIDLYGTKPESILQRCSFILTTKTTRKFVRAFNVQYRPIELNLMQVNERFKEGGDYNIYLIATTDYIKNKNYNLPMGAYVYFAGINFMTLSFALRFSINIPRLALESVLRRLKVLMKW